MTIFKDRLPNTIPIKKKFAPSAERVRLFRNKTIAVFYIVLAVILLAIVLDWLSR